MALHAAAWNNMRSLLIFSISAFLLWDFSDAQRKVEIQKGLLYRVAGYPADIMCNVSGYKGGDQDFEFSIYMPSRPNTEIKIISTRDPNICYAIYKKRVTNGEISIRRLAGDSVQLHINKLQSDDAGEYECYTPSTDGVHFGTYSDKMNLAVIEDTLSAKMEEKILNKVEGERLVLDCEVSKETFQHTHVEIAWYLKKGDTKIEIISLQKEFTLQPGTEYKERYEAGQVRLDKTGSTIYTLIISQLKVSDTGDIYCAAGEWIQDPDRSWYQISSKETKPVKVSVSSLGSTFNTKISSTKTNLIERESLELSCTIEAQAVAHRYFLVSLLKDTSKVAGFGPTGVPEISDLYIPREKSGEIKVFKKSTNEYWFKVLHVGKEDEGKYLCEVTEMKPGQDTEFKDGEKKSSNEESIVITPLQSQLNIAISSDLTITEGDTVYISCNVTGTDDQLSVSWILKTNNNEVRDILSISQSGMVELGEKYKKRFQSGDIKAYRASQESFMLQVSNSLPSDEGKYMCTLTQWVPDAAEKWKQGERKSKEVRVAITSLATSLSLSLKSRIVSVQENGNISFICTTKGPRVPLSVTWTFQPNELTEETIVSINYNGNVKWSEIGKHFQTRTKVENAEGISKLSIAMVSASESGKYQCHIEAWIAGIKRAQKSSNQMKVDVNKPASKLSVVSMPPSLKAAPGADIEIKCKINTRTFDSSQFAVSWYFSQVTNGLMNATILKTDRENMLHAVELSSPPFKYQIKRASKDLYILSIMQADVNDTGMHYCVVEEWLQDGNREWYLLDQKSTKTDVTVSSAGNKVHVMITHENISTEAMKSFQLNCHITSHSSNESRFDVTWSRMSEAGQEQDIFKAQRFSTSLSTVVKDRILVFENPEQGLYSLTMQNAEVQDSGRYVCHVEEWLLTHRTAWHKIAEGRSGISAVYVTEQEQTTFSVVCSSKYLFTFVFIYPFIVITLLLILVTYLLFKLRTKKTNESSKKSNGTPLWKEMDPVKFFAVNGEEND
ncbi:immunoglobulin superfamily member 3-like [Erpetoichthys calabaricus]|uniref:immunoglobulin superfamily member 3-like n=1 Tax=Erpetoichthys calabaricus TaxID=27687 RepID=UPI002233F0EA|nr:immunoglobulin superfamily member 3-like [Erpetoichthys calabaricus]XP_028656564.2 immunoglobulin superfamily member 3-like [Erpetoichthys calabaricus]XP_051782017.1 immunoglobulin superfamily member 3-like [Erpetoichthys calabaricus]